MSGLRRLERAAWAVGILLVVVWGAAKLHSHFGARRDLERFAAARAARVTSVPSATAALPALTTPTPARSLVVDTPPDYALWSRERIKAYEESLQEKSNDPLGVLRIPKIGLEVAVLEGTDDFTLNRAVGHVEDTARPGENGNVCIAGHRDGFFRGLKDIARGDTLELETLSGTETYRVAEIRIVRPENVEVLDPTPEPTVTLVACYPFYFVGHAPRRYIVRAVRQEPAVNAAR